MAGNIRPKMDRASRAKQFMPFDALKGFREALAEKEGADVPGKGLSVEYERELEIKKHRMCRIQGAKKR